MSIKDTENTKTICIGTSIQSAFDGEKSSLKKASFQVGEVSKADAKYLGVFREEPNSIIQVHKLSEAGKQALLNIEENLRAIWEEHKAEYPGYEEPVVENESEE